MPFGAAKLPTTAWGWVVLVVWLSLTTVVLAIVTLNVETFTEAVGWDRLWSARVGSFTFSEILLGLLLLLAGFLVGHYLERWVRRAQGLPQPEDLQAEAQALADRAEAVAAKVAVLAGEYTAEHARAWQKDTAEFMSKAKKGGSMAGHRHSSEVQAAFLQKFGERHLTEVLSVVASASKLIVVDQWEYRNILSSGHDLPDVPRKLIALAAALRTGRPDVPSPERIKRMEIELRQLREERAKRGGA